MDKKYKNKLYFSIPSLLRNVAKELDDVIKNAELSAPAQEIFSTMKCALNEMSRFCWLICNKEDKSK